MAIETKVVQIENTESNINAKNEIMSCFGWSVMNVQITHSQNTRTYTSGLDSLAGNQTQTVETTTINYATVTYQRDKGLCNYQQIVSLEKEFERIDRELSDAIDADDFDDAVGCLKLIAGSLFWPIRLLLARSEKKNEAQRAENKKQMQAKINSLRVRRQEILDEAQALLT